MATAHPKASDGISPAENRSPTTGSIRKKLDDDVDDSLQRRSLSEEPPARTRRFPFMQVMMP